MRIDVDSVSSGERQASSETDEKRRAAILNLFLQDNPAFEVHLRELKARKLPDNDRIVRKSYEEEPLAAQIERHCLHLQAVLFNLSVFPDIVLPDEVLEAYFEATGNLVHAIFYLSEYGVVCCDEYEGKKRREERLI